MSISRRGWLQSIGVSSLLGAAAVGRKLNGQTAQALPRSHENHSMGLVGRITSDQLSPMRYLRAWNFSDLPDGKRQTYYRETARPDGSMFREYEFYAVDREIEIAPGLFFPAWTYNGQVPGPTIRATEGDRIRVTFTNAGSDPGRFSLSLPLLIGPNIVPATFAGFMPGDGDVNRVIGALSGANLGGRVATTLIRQ